MKRIIIIISFISLFVGCRNVKKIDYRDEYMKLWAIFLAPTEEAISKGSNVSIFHLWKEMMEGDYLFGEPADEQIKEWRRLCYAANPENEIDVGSLRGYASINQYMTVQDLYGLWYYRSDSLRLNDDLTLWRLEMYDTKRYDPASEYERFSFLKKRIDSLTSFDPQFQVDMNLRASFKADLQEFYNRVLLRETIGQSDDKVALALKRENDAWLNYHAQVDSAFRIIDGNPEGMIVWRYRI